MTAPPDRQRQLILRASSRRCSRGSTRHWHVRPRWRRNSLRGRRTGQRNSEFGERIEHQAATIDVLKAMSASPGDPQPVFDLIVRRATRTVRCPIGTTLFEFDGELVHIRSDYRSETILAPSALAAYAATVSYARRRAGLSLAGRSWIGRSSISGIWTTDRESGRLRPRTRAPIASCRCL